MNQSEILSAFQLAASRKLAINTEQCYRTWICKFLSFLSAPHARAVEGSEQKIELFLSGMAREAMGHSDIRTTAGYGRKDCEEMSSPLDRIVKFPTTKTA